MTVHAFVTDKRLIKACRAISEGMNISQAYQAAGFSDYSSFLRNFKNAYGISPENTGFLSGQLRGIWLFLAGGSFLDEACNGLRLVKLQLFQNMGHMLFYGEFRDAQLLSQLLLVPPWPIRRATSASLSVRPLERSRK